MFDLEQAILNWRREMQVVGITEPGRLDELECHLREEIRELAKVGMDEFCAFAQAAAVVGQAQKLQAEFGKTASDDRKWKLLNGILAGLWVIGCLFSLNTVCRQLASSEFDRTFPNGAFFYFSVLATFIYLAGILGGTLVLLGSKSGARILRVVALLFVVACVGQILDFRMVAAWRLWCGAVAMFSLLTIWLLHKPPGTGREVELSIQ